MNSSRKGQNAYLPDDFEPLVAPRVTAPSGEKPEPVNWFETLAPRLPEKTTQKRPSDFDMERVEADGAQRVAFRDVEEIADAERRRRMKKIPEPPEIAQFRKDAQEDARRIIAEAQEAALLLKEEARHQGYEAGYAKGFTEGAQEATRQVQAQAEAERQDCRADIADFIALVEQERRRAWEEIEPQVIALVFGLAKQVIKQEVEVSRAVALSVVRNALRRVAEGGNLRIRVHANDLETIRGNREELLTLVDNIRHVEIIEDRRVDAGGCIVETDAGNIDARMETQLAEAASLLDLKTH